MGSTVSSNVSAVDLKASHSDPQNVSVILVTESALKKLQGQASKQATPANGSSVSATLTFPAKIVMAFSLMFFFLSLSLSLSHYSSPKIVIPHSTVNKSIE